MLHYIDDEHTEKIALMLLAKFFLPKEKKKNKKETDMECLLDTLAPVYSEYPVSPSVYIHMTMVHKSIIY